MTRLCFYTYSFLFNNGVCPDGLAVEIDHDNDEIRFIIDCLPKDHWGVQREKATIQEVVNHLKNRGP